MIRKYIDIFPEFDIKKELGLCYLDLSEHNLPISIIAEYVVDIINLCYPSEIIKSGTTLFELNNAAKNAMNSLAYKQDFCDCLKKVIKDMN